MHFFWSVKNLFLNECYILLNYIILNVGWRLEAYALFFEM